MGVAASGIHENESSACGGCSNSKVSKISKFQNTFTLKCLSKLKYINYDFKILT